MKSKSIIYDLKRFGISFEYLKNIFVFKNQSILVNSIPKSGTHLVENLLIESGCYRRLLIPTINDENIGKYRNRLLKGLKKPNVFALSHLTSKPSEWGIKNKQIIILNFRDPRDALLSYYDHFKKHNPEIINYFHENNLSKNETLKLMSYGLEKFGFKSLKQRYSLYIDQIKSEHGNVIVTKFEELLTNSRTLERDLKHNRINVRLKKSSNGPTINKGVKNRYISEMDEKLLHTLNEYLKDELMELDYQVN